MLNKKTMIVNEILRIRRSLRTLDSSLHRLSPFLASAASANGEPRVNSRSRPRLSTKARASMVLQGRYMGFMRQLKPRQKAQVRKVREAQGVRAAIQRAKNLNRA